MSEHRILRDHPDAKAIYDAFVRETGLRGIPVEVKHREGGDLLVIHMVEPQERHFQLLDQAVESSPRTGLFQTVATLKSDSPENRLDRPETAQYLSVLSESLAVTRDSFDRGFSQRYISSVSGAEDQLLADASHVVYGRRGSGKSSLLLHTLWRREQRQKPNVWVELQVYQNRSGPLVALDVLWEIVTQVKAAVGLNPGLASTSESLDLARNDEDLSDESLRELLPPLRRALGQAVGGSESLFIFLDDLHVIPTGYQPTLLGMLNAIARGNNIYLKISSIESFTRLLDAATKDGLEVVHDVQVVKLDYNLTRPDKAHSHIERILDAHAQFAGLPSARYLCNDAAVLDRLVWVAAGVPRDALNVFAQAIAKAVSDDRKSVTVTDINVAASEALDDKLRDVQLDGSGHYDDAMEVLEEIKRLCVRDRKINAFLVEIQNDQPTYENVLRLIDLRLLHVIHEGITKDRAGEKFMALILDYGFYVGVRAAKSVELFRLPQSGSVYETLRSLPVLRP